MEARTDNFRNFDDDISKLYNLIRIDSNDSNELPYTTKLRRERLVSSCYRTSGIISDDIYSYLKYYKSESIINKPTYFIIEDFNKNSLNNLQHIQKLVKIIASRDC